MMMTTTTMVMVMINIIKLNIMGECSNERWSFHFKIISQNISKMAAHIDLDFVPPVPLGALGNEKSSEQRAT